MLRWAWKPKVATATEPWYSNRVIHDAAEAVSKVPGGNSLAKFAILAAVCLIVRLFRVIPGWLALPVSLVAALSGVLLAIAWFPLVVAYWPLTIGLLVVSLIIVASTRR